MTIQMVSFGADLVMLLTAAGVTVLLGAVVVQLARRRRHAAGALVRVLGAVVLIYGTALIGVGLTSSTAQLKPGDTKCFDDWCVTMAAARLDTASGSVTVDLQLENRGRGRPMRSDLARAYLEIPNGAEVAPRDGSGMQAMLPAGQKVPVQLTFPAARDLDGARLVVVEGTGVGPGTFEIGGEGSPFHPKVGWPLSGATDLGARSVITRS